ncbi:MAG TPA: gfo/Idh/MocA family oxidoreductase, partial [Candidatus Latescibacteria bacterium]|nr:gfo/Idh/MocA family oxidoreductase [Candidatus Latescibacterota bacterium]
MQRVGVVGLGPIGNRHADIYQRIPAAELAAVCDIDRERTDSAAARLGVPACYSVAEMLDGVGLDLVSVATGGEEYASDH